MLFLVRLTCAHPDVTADDLGGIEPERPEIARFTIDAESASAAELLAINKYIGSPNPNYAEFADIFVLETQRLYSTKEIVASMNLTVPASEEKTAWLNDAPIGREII
jgi:hypothetical protein